MRIELGEVEAALLTHESLAQAAVTIHRSESTGENLVAYVVPRSGARVDTKSVQDAAAQVLPAYMVPARVVVLDSFPLGASGKLDRKALPEPEFATVAVEYVAPRTPMETVVAGVFADVLGAERVGSADSFFDLGGNSISATRLTARLRAADRWIC